VHVPYDPETSELTLRFKPSIRKIAAEAAAAECRSISSYVQWLILRDSGHWPPDPSLGAVTNSQRHGVAAAREPSSSGSDKTTHSRTVNLER
jgi:hypothetical protein